MEYPLSLINSLEASVFNRDGKKALNLIIELLTNIDSTGFHFQTMGAFSDSENSRINSTRIISCLIQLLSDNRFKINKVKYLLLMNVKKNIDSLFRVSGFHANQSILNYFVNQYELAKNSNLKQSNLFKMLIFMRLADHTSESLKFLTQIDKSISLPHILSLLSSSVIFQEQEHINREQLLALGSHFDDQVIAFENTGILAVAWMHTSYAERKDKHDFKVHLNKIMNNTLLNDHFVLPQVKTIDSESTKPKILVIVEVLFSHHAMARCYSNYIMQLKRNFEVVLFGATNSVDEDALKIFDSYVLFDQSKTTIHQISELLARQKADIVFYPSIGMSTWVIALLTVRFAPVQIAATGHPATTKCNSIDYLIAPDFLLQYEDYYSEKLVTLPNALDNTHASISKEIYPNANLNKDRTHIKIAVNGKSSKINTNILSVCEKINQKIDQQGTLTIEWVFFTNENGFLHYHCEFELQKRLSNASVVKSQDYSSYLQDLNHCHLALSPFPFGGSNSNIDLLRLGIPIVYLTGKEAHSRTDEFYLSNFGLVDGLACESSDEVINRMTELITDHNKREQLSKLISNKNTDELLISEDIISKSDVVDTFNWIWRDFLSEEKNQLKTISYKRIIQESKPTP